MIILTWISVLLLIQTSQSYVLLTANLDDVQTLMHQVMQSPAAEKFGQYVRRAASMFNQQTRSRADDDKDLNESPFVRQVVNVLRSAYSVIKNQFNVVDKDGTSVSQNSKQGKQQELNTVESSAEQDHTRRRAHRHHRHKHSRKRYPVPHKSSSRRTDPVDSETDKKANTLAASPGDGTPMASEERRDKLKVTNEMLSLGKNASRYLDTIKEIIEKSTI